MKTVEELLGDDTVLRGHREASEWLREHGYSVSDKSLRNMACAGGGPRFFKWGVFVMYREKDLRQWAEGRWWRM